jgi:hypothetical protein
LFLSVVSVPACSSSATDASCTDGLKNGDEVGVDCGGSCTTLCTGDRCTADDQCASAKCTNGTCAARPGKPCGLGTPVATCDNGQPCELDKDCKSLTCDGNVCALTADSPPGPADGKKNNGETDVDCGGPNAPACANGKTCAVDTDCADKYCPPDKKVCAAASYTDGVKNGTETDVDCGGTVTTAGFKTCAQGKTCLADTDCNGACNYQKKCVDMPSCKPNMGGDTCGGGDLGAGNMETHETAAGQAPGHEDCCRTLEVKGYTDPGHAGKKVYLDKYEVTAGRVRAFVEWLAAKNAGEPNMRAWVVANKPAIWNDAWNQFLPTGMNSDSSNMPHNPNPPSGGNVPPPWNVTVGVSWVFGSNIMVYVHGHDTFHKPGSYGFTTFWYPPAVMVTPNNGVARVNPHDATGKLLVAKDELDQKSMTAIPNAILQAFCTWDGGQLATDEVLDFVTASPPTLGSKSGCGTQTGTGGTGGRCADLAKVNATSDSGTSNGGVNPLNYNYPYYDNGSGGTETSEGVNRLSAPGRLPADTVRINAGDEPWLDVHGNLHEAVLDMTGATFVQFGLKYRGIGYSSARAQQNTTALTYPEYRAGYSGGRCMRFK